MIDNVDDGDVVLISLQWFLRGPIAGISGDGSNPIGNRQPFAGIKTRGGGSIPHVFCNTPGFHRMDWLTE